MAFTIPNEADAGVADQAEPDSVDIDILVAGFGTSGVSSGCAVTAQGTPDMTVAVASGEILVAGTPVTVASGNVTITAADGSNARFDLVVVNNSGTKSATAGTPSSNPAFPSIPANSIVLATVYVPNSDTTIESNQITDKRVILTGGLGLLDDIAQSYGNTLVAPNVKQVWDTTDANANIMMMNLPVGGDPDVPVFAIGIGIVGVDLGANGITLNGITQPQIVIVDADRDAAFGVGFIGDDAPGIQLLGSASGFMIGLAASAPSPDVGAVHIWKGDAGAITANANSVLVFERNDTAFLNILAPNNRTTGILFGSPADAARGRIQYSGSTSSPTDTLSLFTAGIERLQLNATSMNFQQATTITTTAGNLMLSPTDALSINPGNSNVNFNLSDIFGLRSVRGDDSINFKIQANTSLTAATARRLEFETLDTVGDTYVLAAYAVPTATETTPFWAQRADITTPVTGSLDASFLTFKWNPGDDSVVVYVNDGGTIRSVAIGTVT